MRLPYPIARGFLRFLWPWMTGYSDVVVAPSASSKRLLRSFGVKRPIEVILNGIEVERFRNCINPLTKQQLGVPQTSTLAIYVGRLAAEKNLEKLLCEFSLAVGERPTLHLLLVGSGPAQTKLIHLATKLNIAKQLVFSGAVSHQEIPRYLAAADFFVTASQSEVLPLTLIEAMAASLPVAAIRSPGIDDLTQHRKTGILTCSQNGDLARGILCLASDPAERARLGNSAYQNSRRYHIHHTVGQTIRLYKRLIREQSRAHANQGQDEAKILWKAPGSKSN
jgi:glycosyltransferase involved in cell wall biosynthesis